MQGGRPYAATDRVFLDVAMSIYRSEVMAKPRVHFEIAGDDILVSPSLHAVLSRRDMTRQEVLRFNPRWSDRDRALINESMDALGHAISGYRGVPSGQYVRINGPEGDEPGGWLFYLTKGRIVFRAGDGPDSSSRSSDGDYDEVLLSTAIERNGARPITVVERQVCSLCWTERSASGSCACG